MRWWAMFHLHVATALAWLVAVDGIALNRIDLFGGGLILLGALLMVAGHWTHTWPPGAEFVNADTPLPRR